MSEWRVKLYRGVYAAVRTRDGRTERTSLRTADLQEAKRRLKDWTAKPVGETVGDLVEVYLTDKDKTAIRAVTWAPTRARWRGARTCAGCPTANSSLPLRAPPSITRCRASGRAIGSVELRKLFSQA